MEVLNVVGVILGIVSSAISIYVFFIDRPRRRAQHAEQVMHASPKPAPPPPTADEETASRGFTLSKVGAVFWGVLGFGCLSEGMTFGEPFLLVLGGLFFWLAYKMWKS